MRILEVRDIVSLLRSGVERAGCVSAWARKTGIERTCISKTLSNKRPPSESIIKALKLRTVFVAERKEAPN
jgi:DNA-binding phage protein